MDLENKKNLRLTNGLRKEKLNVGAECVNGNVDANLPDVTKYKHNNAANRDAFNDEDKLAIHKDYYKDSTNLENNDNHNEESLLKLSSKCKDIHNVGSEENVASEDVADRTYQNGDSNNNFVEDDDDEKAKQDWVNLKVKIPEYSEIGLIETTFDSKIETVTLVKGNISSSGVEGSSERSESNLETIRTDRVSKEYPKTKRYTRVSKKSATLRTLSDKESGNVEREELVENLCFSHSSKQEGPIMLKPKQGVLKSSKTTDKEIPSSETKLPSSVHYVSDNKLEENSKSCCGEGNTSSVGDVEEKTGKETKEIKADRDIPEDPATDDIDGNVKIPTNITPIRQSSYKIAVKQYPTAPKEKSKSKIISPEKDVECEKAIPKKKPFLRKSSYEMAITSEISKKSSPKSPTVLKMVEPINILSVKSMLKIKELAALEEKRNFEFHEDNATSEKKHNATPEKKHDESAQNVQDESERSCTESFTATGSTSTCYEQQKFSNFEKILPLGGILTLVKEKLSTGSPCSLSDSLNSLPWDTLGSQLNKASSVDTLASPVSQTSRISSNSTSVEELVHHLKDNRIAAWFASFEQLLRLAKSDSSNNDEAEASNSETALPGGSTSPQEKCSPELVKLIVHLENLKSRLNNNVKLTDLYAHITESKTKEDTNVDDSLPEIEDDNETVKIIIKQLNNMSVDESNEVKRLYIFPHEVMMEIMLSGALPHINEHIIKVNRKSRARKPSLHARKFRIRGEVVLLEEDLPICKACNIMSVYILWARQIIARLDEKHVYANVPPYAENLTVIKRILGKIRNTFLEEFNFAKTDPNITGKSENFNMRGVRKKKGSRRKRHQFVKGAIEVIPELNEDSDDEDEDHVYGAHPFPYSCITTMSEPTPSASEQLQKSETNAKAKSNDTKNSDHIYDNVEFDSTSIPEYDSKWMHKYPNLEKYVCRYIDDDGKLVEFFTPIELSDSTQTTCRIPWWKMWKSPKKGKNKGKKSKIVFPNEPLSMNLIHHGGGRLEVMYGNEDEYPYTVSGYSAEDGRYLTLEENFLKKYFCYKPPNEYFFSMNDCNSNLTVVKVSKQSNFFLVPTANCTHYPPVYSFVTTDFPGRCPNKKINLAKQVLLHWFSRGLTTSNRGFVEEQTPIKSETSIASYSPVEQPTIDYLDEPPKVGPKPYHYQQITESLPLGIKLLSPGVYFYPYDVTNPKPQTFLRVIVKESRPMCFIVCNVDDHLFLQRLADLCCESKQNDDGLHFKNVIFKVNKSASALFIDKYTFASNPPTLTSISVINENDTSYVEIESLLSEEYKKPEQNPNVSQSKECEVQRHRQNLTLEMNCSTEKWDYPIHSNNELNDFETISDKIVIEEIDSSIEPDTSNHEATFFQFGHKQPRSYPSTSSNSPIPGPVFETTHQTELFRQVKKEVPDYRCTLNEPLKPRRHRSWSYPSTSTHSPNLLTVFEIPQRSESPYQLSTKEITNISESSQEDIPSKMISQEDPDGGIYNLSKSSKSKVDKAVVNCNQSEESQIPDWYLPRQSRPSTQQKLNETQSILNEIDTKNSIPDYANISALKETHRLIETYKYPWEDPRSVHSVYSGLLTQDKVTVRRRNSTGETKIPFYENITIPELSRSSRCSLELRPLRSFGASHNRLIPMLDMNRLPSGNSPTLIPVPDDIRQQLSPSFYSLSHYPLTETWHHSGIYPCPSRNSIETTSDKIPWRPSRLYTSASRHTIETCNARGPLAETMHHPGKYPWYPPRRSVGTSPIKFLHSQVLSSSSSRSGVCACSSKQNVCNDCEKDKLKTISSSSVSTETNRSFASRHSVGTVPEKLKLRLKGKMVSSEVYKSARFQGKYISRSSEHIADTTVPFTKQDLTATVTKNKSTKCSRENVAERIAYHYLTEDSDTETSFSKDQMNTIRKQKKKGAKEESDTETSVSREQKITKKRYKKKCKKFSRSNDDIAERIAHHYLIGDEADVAMSSMSSYSYSISSSRTSQSCPVHGPSPNPVELPDEQDCITRSMPFLLCGWQSPMPSQDQTGPVERRSSPIWIKKTRTKTV